MNVLAQSAAPLYATSWAGKTGISDPQLESSLEWARSVEVVLDKARQYGRDVYASIDTYLAGLTDDDLSHIIDLSQHGYGEWALDAFLVTFVLGHIRDIMGEISAIKGVQGLQGVPF